MAKISIQNFQNIIKSLPLLNEEIGRIIGSSVNATAKFLKDEATKQISSNTGLDAERVEKGITIIKASESRTGNTGQETATVSASGKRLMLINYDPAMSFIASRGTVSADISMLRSIQVIKQNTFANPSRPRLALKRKTEQAYPLSATTGPSIGHHFDRITPSLIKIGEEDLSKRFSTRIRNAMKRIS